MEDAAKPAPVAIVGPPTVALRPSATPSVSVPFHAGRAKAPDIAAENVVDNDTANEAWLQSLLGPVRAAPDTGSKSKERLVQTVLKILEQKAEDPVAINDEHDSLLRLIAVNVFSAKAKAENEMEADREATEAYVKRLREQTKLKVKWLRKETESRVKSVEEQAEARMRGYVEHLANFDALGKVIQEKRKLKNEVLRREGG